jgi:hypothetical protein
MLPKKNLNYFSLSTSRNQATSGRDVEEALVENLVCMEILLCSWTGTQHRMITLGSKSE